MASPFLPSVSSPSFGRAINLESLSFSADELRGLNELIVKAILESPTIDTFATLHRGIKNDAEIGLIPGKYELVGLPRQGCDPLPHAYELVAEMKKWQPRWLEVILDICITEMEESFLKIALACGIDVFDLTKTQIADWILDRMIPAINDMIFRYAWFGDTDADNISGSGNITDGVHVEFFNVLDGFFKQLAEITAKTPERATEIPGNSESTYADQRAVTAVDVAAAVNDLIDSALPELAIQPDRMLIVSQSVFQKLRRYLQGVGTVFQDYKLMVNGIELANWDGIPLYSFPMWDRMIQKYQNNGTKWNYPHRVLYTCKSNLAIGMTCTSLFDKVDVFYDRRSRYNRLEAADAFDMKILDDRLVQVGN
ncbi:MAG: hypothetical protein RBT61_00355 [Candidatus Kapabacteria bacterium]|jgi:hypothetical protein|nr:hypothetical protein [Candidatus Kapabacteria bacterium]